MFNGSEFSYLYGEKLLSYVTYAPGGQSTPNCTRSFTANSVTHDCVSAGHPSRLEVRYSTPVPNTYASWRTQYDPEQPEAQMFSDWIISLDSVSK